MQHSALDPIWSKAGILAVVSAAVDSLKPIGVSALAGIEGRRFILEYRLFSAALNVYPMLLHQQVAKCPEGGMLDR